MYGVESPAASASASCSQHATDAAAAPAAAGTSGETDTVYRRIERSYRLVGPSSSASSAASSKRSRRSKHSPVPSSESPDEEWTRWRAHTIDCRHHERNTPELNARIVEHPLAASGTPAGASWLSPSARLFSCTSHPGFLFISRALTPESQAWWSWKCLHGYSAAEHTNLTNLEVLRRKDEEKKRREAALAAGESADAIAASVSVTASSSSSNVASSSSASLWSSAHRGDFVPLSKLRWSSLGYHYDWTSREYTATARTAFPADLARLSEEIARAAGFDQLKSEAAIVNYYPASGMMGAHVDDAELTKLQPIVSVSLGCAAIFLLGGRTKSDPPIGFLLRSGDAVIMGGESRVCFHGVPRIIDRSFQSTDWTNEGDLAEERPDAKRRKEEEAKEESKDDSAVAASASSSSASIEWTPEAAVAALRHRSSSLSTSLDSAIAFPLVVGADVPTRADLVTAYRYLRHARLNLNVRQVEDELFQYRQGMTSESARRMAIEEQQQRAQQQRHMDATER